MTARSRLRSLTPLLVVSDLQRSIDFYVQRLGFADPSAHGEPPCFAMINRDGLDLMLSLAERPEHVRPNGPHGAWDLYLAVGDVDVEQAALEQAGLAIEKGPTDTFYRMREIEVVDPDGHRICLAQDTSDEPLVNADAYAGALDYGSTRLRLVLKISRSGHGYVGRLDSLDQGAMNLPIDSVTVEGSTLRFAMKAIGATFEGTFDAGMTRIDGKWTQRGGTWPLVLSKSRGCEAAGPAR